MNEFTPPDFRVYQMHFRTFVHLLLHLQCFLVFPFKSSGLRLCALMHEPHCRSSLEHFRPSTLFVNRSTRVRFLVLFLCITPKAMKFDCVTTYVGSMLAARRGGQDQPT